MSVVVLSGSVGVSFKLVGVFDGVTVGGGSLMRLVFFDCARVMALIELVCGVSMIIKIFARVESILL